MEVKILNKSGNPLPVYETEYSAGMDLRAYLNEELVIKPLQRVMVPTGLYISLPPGYEAQIRPRSGLAYKHGITVLNSPGTIDSDYRGEIKAILINMSDEEFVIRSGDRICQMIISEFRKVSWNEVTVLEMTKRGAGGFGHTGK
jgi:dUTP pyrophosphatase